MANFFNWKLLLGFALPMVEAAGEAKVNEDENHTGKDDAIGESLIYLAKLASALIHDKPLPKAPQVLR